MAHKFAPAQIAYMKAKAAYEAILSETSHVMAPYADLLDTEDGIAAYVKLEMDTQAALGYWAASDALRRAETDLLTWGHDAVRTDPKTMAAYTEKAADLDGLFASIHKHPVIRAKLIDLTARLAL